MSTKDNVQRTDKPWTIGTIRAKITEDWKDLNPKILKDSPDYGYGKKSELIIFDSDEIVVGIHLVKEPHAPDDMMHFALMLSLSPKPFALDTHVLNTLDLNYFMAIMEGFAGKRVFAIGKHQPWEESSFAHAINVSNDLIKDLQKFNSCFDTLTNSSFEVEGNHFSTEKYPFDQFMTRIKGYRLAEIYNHANKLDKAYDFIKKSIDQNDLAQRSIATILQNPHGGLAWLYSPSLILKLREDYSNSLE